MLENSGDFAFDYMYLREIIFFHEKVEKLLLRYNGLRKVKWNSTYALNPDWKSFFYINIIFVENCIVIVFTFSSSFPREEVDSLYKLCDEVCF